jgi:hypothetical protein
MLDLKNFQQEVRDATRGEGHDASREPLIECQRTIASLHYMTLVASVDLKESIVTDKPEVHYDKLDKSAREKRRALGAILIHIAEYCNQQDIDLESAVRSTWWEWQRGPA